MFDYETLRQVLVAIRLFRTNKRLIHSWRTNAKSVNHISNHDFKCLSGSLIPTDMSECAAKFRFASVTKSPDTHFLLQLVSAECDHEWLFLPDFEMTKNCRPQLTRNQKRMMIDLFQAGLTPVEVIDHLNTFVPCGNTFPGCTSKSCVNQMKDGHGFNYSSVHNDFSYRQVG